MKTNIKPMIIIFLIFTAMAYSKVIPLELSISHIKQDFFKTPTKSINLKSINLIKPVSVSLEGNIDFRKSFSKKN